MRKRIAAGLLVLAALAVTAAPAAAAPGYRIAFARQLMPFGANIFTIRPNGSGERQVPLVYPAEDFGTPLWSLDRRELLITHTLRLTLPATCCRSGRRSSTRTARTSGCSSRRERRST
jgi:hypothetical protein